MPPVVFIHGTNAGPWTMRNFRAHFEAAGFACHSPAYRYHDPTPSRTEPEALVGLGIADYVDDIADAISGLAERPILIGHSLGGVVAQKLAARNMASACVLLNSSVVNGVLPTTREERSLGKAFMGAGAFWETTMLPDFETMATFGLNKLPEREQHTVFDQLGPESGRVLFELFFWMFDENQTTRIDFDAIDCPVLFISGSEDLAIPPSTARVTASRHRHADFHEAEGFGHYLMLEPNWREIATLAEAWIRDKVS